MQMDNGAGNTGFLRDLMVISGIFVCLLLVISPVSATGAENTAATNSPYVNGASSAGGCPNQNAINGTSVKIFPAISTISPAEGFITGGTAVTITGTNLGRNSKVMFGSTPATNVTWVSTTKLIAISPAHEAGTVDIIVTTPRGTTEESPAGRFTYQINPEVVKTITVQKKTNATILSGRVWTGLLKNSPPPVLSGISPATGSVNGGTVVTITGMRLGRGSKILFGTTAATSVAQITPKKLLVTSPPHAAGTVNVTVITPRGTSEGSPVGMFIYS